MRTIEFNELKLNDIKSEEQFYQNYLKNITNQIEENNVFHYPEKQYEIFYLNALNGKIILLDKNYINSNNSEGQEIFYDYSIAYKIYNIMLDIYEGIEDEKNEFNELYKIDRLELNEEIDSLKKQDEKIFQQKIEEYNIIINSFLYKEYIKIKEENKILKLKIDEFVKKTNNVSIVKDNNIGFFRKFINKLKKY